MFTGLIEAVCAVKSANKRSDSMELVVDIGQLSGDTKVGDSIAINGVCLTVSSFKGQSAGFDVSGETLSKSNLASLRPSCVVNAERAMRPSDRFGGHFVLGHADGTAKIQSIENKGRFWQFKFSAEPDIINQLVAKGSVAVDGVSLTIAELDEKSFSVAIIPQTWEKTTLLKLKIGDAVNIEIDIITKTVKKQLQQILPQQQGLTIEKLRQSGF